MSTAKAGPCVLDLVGMARCAVCGAERKRQATQVNVVAYPLKLPVPPSLHVRAGASQRDSPYLFRHTIV
jgi:hypothetical protein